MTTTINVTINNINYIAITDGIDTLINLCPHAVNFVLNGEDIQVPASGQLARVSAKTVTADVSYNSIPVTYTSYGEVEGLPERKENTIYVVSSLVASRVPNREDVFIPNESVRDPEGRIVGCKSLGHV